MRGRAMCSMTTSVNGIHSGSPQTHGTAVWHSCEGVDRMHKVNSIVESNLNRLHRQRLSYGFDRGDVLWSGWSNVGFEYDGDTRKLRRGLLE
jgi:hypothetical protein